VWKSCALTGRSPTTGDEPASLVACWRRRAAPRHPGLSTTSQSRCATPARCCRQIPQQRPELAILICDNFLYGFQGHAFGAPGRAVPGLDQMRGHGSHRGETRTGPGKPPDARAGSRGDAPTPGRQPAAPYGREPTGRGAATGRLPRSRRQAVPRSNAPRGDRACKNGPGPSSSRRAFCRRAKITVKSARCARVLRMALRATPDCDLARQDPGKYQEDGPPSTRAPLTLERQPFGYDS
jgi:hypothetical protein